MKHLMVSCLLCASLELTPVLAQVNNNNGNLKIENKEVVGVTVPCISCMDESCSLPEGYILPNLEELTPSVPIEQWQSSTPAASVSVLDEQWQLPTPTASASVPDEQYQSPTPTVSPSVYEEEILTEEEFFQIQEQNFIDRSIDTDLDIKYNYENYIYPLAKIIFAEAGNMGDEHQRYVGYVVMNRVKSVYFPNTIEEVFFNEDAYAETSRERYLKECVTDQAIKNAEIVIKEYLSDTMPVSPAMVYQAEFKQGVENMCIQMGNTFFGFDQRIIDDLNSNLDDDPGFKKDTNK